MKVLRFIIVLLLPAVLVVGCGSTAKQMQIKSQVERTDIFADVKPDETIPQGFSEMSIKANIKTPLSGHYILESREYLYEKQGYPFLLNIDGQAALWKVKGVKDIKPDYDKDGRTSHDPEAGQGIKYILEKRLKLAPGMHKVFFGLLEEGYSTEIDITVEGGQSIVLEYRPIYKYKTLPNRIPTFFKGISNYEVFINGKKIW